MWLNCNFLQMVGFLLKSEPRRAGNLKVGHQKTNIQAATEGGFEEVTSQDSLVWMAFLLLILLLCMPDITFN